MNFTKSLTVDKLLVQLVERFPTLDWHIQGNLLECNVQGNINELIATHIPLNSWEYVHLNNKTMFIDHMDFFSFLTSLEVDDYLRQPLIFTYTQVRSILNFTERTWRRPYVSPQGLTWSDAVYHEWAFPK